MMMWRSNVSPLVTERQELYGPTSVGPLPAESASTDKRVAWAELPRGVAARASSTRDKTIAAVCQRRARSALNMTLDWKARLGAGRTTSKQEDSQRGDD